MVKNIQYLQLDSGSNINLIITDLRSTGLFEYVEPDRIGSGSGVSLITPNDADFYRQWGFVNNGTFSSDAKVDADVSMDDAWTITTGSANTIVCILDSGVKLDHPEFSGRLWLNSHEIPDNGIDDDGNGYVDDINGWDWANNDKDPTDDFGHGTNVAGIIAANANNGIGYAGVDWNCKIMVGKVLNSSNNGSYSWWISGIIYATLNGANIINMSEGGSSFSQPLKDACDFAYANNVAIFACMMNTNNNVPYYPAAFSSTIAIGATDVNDYRVAPFFWDPTSGSNYGAHIDLVAPGNYIYGLSYNSNTNYNTYWGGTSQATPLVTGVASLLHALKPATTVEELRTILRSTAKDLVGRPTEDVPGWDQYMGSGRMDAYQALLSLNSALPVKMSNLSGTLRGTDVVLNWKTFQESNADKFMIEHSADAFKWEPIGTVNAKGYSLTEQDYTFVHSTPSFNINYYRLREVDKDMNIQYSNMVKILGSNTGLYVKAVTPFTDILHLTLSIPQVEPLTIKMYSSQGALVRQFNKSFDRGVNSFDIQTTGLNKGNYIVTVQTGKGEAKTIVTIKR